MWLDLISEDVNELVEIDAVIKDDFIYNFVNISVMYVRAVLFLKLVFFCQENDESLQSNKWNFLV